MGNLEYLTAHRKIPVFVFLENNFLQNTHSILFLTLDAPSLFECIRYYMTEMVNAVANKRLISFSFETRMYSPNEISKIADEINEKKRKLEQQPTPRPVTPNKEKKPVILFLVPPIQ